MHQLLSLVVHLRSADATICGSTTILLVLNPPVQSEGPTSGIGLAAVVSSRMDLQRLN